MATDSLRRYAAGLLRSPADATSALGAGKPQSARPASNWETDEWRQLLDQAEAVAPVDLAGYYRRAGVIIACAASSGRERKNRA
jgi:hypothetical protein